MSVWERLAAHLRPRRNARPQAPFEAVNLTRNTVLATRLILADTSQSRGKGLLGRDGLAPGEGLWIVPCQSIHMFFMRFSIDLVYIDRGKRVRKVTSSIAPWRISACFTAHSVLELPAGIVRQTGTRRGDVLEISTAPSLDSATGAQHICSPESGHSQSGSDERKERPTNGSVQVGRCGPNEPGEEQP